MASLPTSFLLASAFVYFILIQLWGIVKEADRVLLYPKGMANYHVIAETSADVKVGDTVEHEPYGINFGWFIRIVK